MKPQHARAFTLIELLVVITIIGVLVAMLLPALSKTRVVTAVTMCAGNQRQLFIALNAYAGDYREYPYTGVKDQYEAGVQAWLVPADQQIEESRGTGISAFSSDGIYARMYRDRYFTSYKGIQCAARPNFEFVTPGWMTNGVQSNGQDFLNAQWFGYNGPHVWGPYVGNYGSNNGLLWLGGHHPWVNNSWGLSIKEDTHMCYNNYRNGPTPVAQVALLACPGMTRGSYSTSFLDAREPHMDNRQDYADEYGNPANFQTDGPIWTPATQYQVSRNYSFGDGHIRFIDRDNRGYTFADQF